MKLKIFTLIALCALMNVGKTHAQLFWQENFNQPVGALIPGALVSSDNSLVNNPLNLSGWYTQSNTYANVDCFDVAANGLTYNGYISSGIGNAITFNPVSGQSIFKPWKKTIKNDSTVYVSFMLNIPPTLATGGDFFFGLKMDSTATSTNWGSCIYAAVDPAYPGQEITFSIKKSSSGTAVPATTYFASSTTHLVVLKYFVGILNGLNATAETGNYDDQMSLFIDPPTMSTEPSTPTIYCADPTQKDLYRWGTTIAIGGAKSAYLRSSTTAAGSIPGYTIDGIRVGLTWADVMPLKSGLKQTTADNFRYNIDNNKQLTVNTSAAYYNNYTIVALSGQLLLKGLLTGQISKINATSLKSGIYILYLNGNQHASAKFLVK